MKISNYRWAWYLLMLMLAAFSIGPGQASGQAEEQPAGTAPGSHQPPSMNPQGMSEPFKGTVVEVIDAGRHIYVQIDTAKQRVWVAVPAFDGRPGDKVLVPPGVPVADFHSRKLNRTFKIIYFVGGLNRTDGNTPDQPPPKSRHNRSL